MEGPQPEGIVRAVLRKGDAPRAFPRRPHISLKLISPHAMRNASLSARKCCIEKGVVLIDSDGWRFDGEFYVPPNGW